MEVYSSPKNRCKETAKYFLLGWYGHSHDTTNGVFFVADPKYAPPTKQKGPLHQMMIRVDPEKYSDKINFVSMNMTSGHDCLKKEVSKKPLTVD